MPGPTDSSSDHCRGPRIGRSTFETWCSTAVALSVGVGPYDASSYDLSLSKRQQRTPIAPHGFRVLCSAREMPSDNGCPNRPLAVQRKGNTGGTGAICLIRVWRSVSRARRSPDTGKGDVAELRGVSQILQDSKHGSVLLVAPLAGASDLPDRA